MIFCVLHKKCYGLKSLSIAWIFTVIIIAIFLLLIYFFLYANAGKFIILTRADIIFSFLYAVFVIQDIIPMYKNSGRFEWLPVSVDFYFIFIATILGYIFFMNSFLQKYILLIFISFRVFSFAYYNTSILIFSGLPKNYILKFFQLFLLLFLLIFVIVKIVYLKNKNG